MDSISSFSNQPPRWQQDWEELKQVYSKNLGNDIVDKILLPMLQQLYQTLKNKPSNRDPLIFYLQEYLRYEESRKTFLQQLRPDLEAFVNDIMSIVESSPLDLPEPMLRRPKTPSQTMELGGSLRTLTVSTGEHTLPPDEVEEFNDIPATRAPLANMEEDTFIPDAPPEVNPNLISSSSPGTLGGREGNRVSNNTSMAPIISGSPVVLEPLYSETGPVNSAMADVGTLESEDERDQAGPSRVSKSVNSHNGRKQHISRLQGELIRDEYVFQYDGLDGYYVLRCSRHSSKAKAVYFTSDPFKNGTAFSEHFNKHEGHNKTTIQKLFLRHARRVRDDVAKNAIARQQRKSYPPSSSQKASQLRSPPAAHPSEAGDKGKEGEAVHDPNNDTIEDPRPLSSFRDQSATVQPEGSLGDPYMLNDDDDDDDDFDRDCPPADVLGERVAARQRQMQERVDDSEEGSKEDTSPHGSRRSLRTREKPTNYYPEVDLGFEI